jgi:hypothetical protein
MKKLISFVIILLMSAISLSQHLPARESRFCGTTAPSDAQRIVDLSTEIQQLKTEIIRLKTDTKKQNEIITQLKTTCITLKKENKIMREAMIDANLPLPHLFEQFEQEQKKLDEEKQKDAAVEALIKPYFSSPLSVGQIARLRNYYDQTQEIKTVQIIDSNNMIVELYSAMFAKNGKNILYFIGMCKEVVWIRGIDTRKMADEQSIEIGDQPFKITGTKTYEVVMGGTRTVFVLEPYP